MLLLLHYNGDSWARCLALLVMMVLSDTEKPLQQMFLIFCNVICSAAVAVGTRPVSLTYVGPWLQWRCGTAAPTVYQIAHVLKRLATFLQFDCYKTISRADFLQQLICYGEEADSPHCVLTCHVTFFFPFHCSWMSSFWGLHSIKCSIILPYWNPNLDVLTISSKWLSFFLLSFSLRLSILCC